MRLLYYYHEFIKLNNIIYVNYFYWLYNEIFKFNVFGLCIKVRKNFSNLPAFLIFYKCKGVKINQLYFINSPFVYLYKKKLTNIKKKIYLI